MMANKAKLQREPGEMAPIRIGIVGLSASGSWASRAHIPYLADTVKYRIVGVCNSSIASSKKAIETYDLPSYTIPYGSPIDLAKNPDIDLVVVCTRVDRHHEALKSAIQARKDVFVEWPLGASMDEATELRDLAKAYGVRTFVGLQTQASPRLRELKRLINEGQLIGRVLSSTVVAAGMGLGTENTTERYAYQDERKIGGNMLTIMLAHVYDAVSFVLGELQYLQATLSTQYRDVQVRSDDGSKINRTIRRDVADEITISGLLQSGAQSSATMRGGLPFKGEPGLLWRIRGSKGELQVTGIETWAIAFDQDLSLKIHDWASNTVQELEISSSDDETSRKIATLDPVARNVARQYEAYADKGDYPDWDWAVKRHAWIEAVLESSEKGKRVSYL